MKRKRIGLTGGIATGKSTVAAMFAELGAVILDADRVAREVVQPGTPCWFELRQTFGSDFFDADGQLDRRRLRECIISDDRCRLKLNAITHPHILTAMDDAWERITAHDPGRIVIFDVPLLFEINFSHGFETIILVYSPPEVQIQRLMERDCVSRAEAEKTLSIQLPIESKKALSTFVIDNSLDMDCTSRQVKEVWERLTASESP
ncbi:MAG: dephospho-CoA kinase [Acidobacteriota bacterium]